ncbi:hypothetical protein J8628_20285 [Serratia fonticola]|uniref:hypothetical protein n=1 Tax=Serratia fonticola TaxID=47917 RepID=UPI001AE2DB21|nr:hypothetical protein [Serratia fonticola]MBP1019250.1 hypothetical protein [Serratia fonticola]
MYASVRFGSKTRGISDKYSDNDLLIVCADKERKIISDKYLSSEYNVSFFSKKQLFWMRDKGSLFLQHIKRDGVIIYDDNNIFEVFLKDCQFIVPDDNEIKRCESTISFISALPEEPTLVGWKADFIYCVSRDYLIKKLARKGILAFGIDEIISSSLECFKFKNEDLDKFKTLREIKSKNRNEGLDGFNNSDVSFIIRSWLKALRLKFDIKYDDNRELLVDCLFNRNYSSTYEALRCLEALYLLAEVKGVNHIEHHKIIKHIKSPNLYRSLQGSKKSLIKKYIREIHVFFDYN